jgi:hypothetical protein
LEDLSAKAYVEEEYFIEGDAVAYRPIGETGPDGRWSAEPTGTAPFLTRILIRRPIGAVRFNGTVVVGWNNVTLGYDLPVELPSIYEDGFAYACVSAQRVGVHGIGVPSHGLTTWDPERYGTLEHPGDRYSYGIFTQAALAVGPKRPTSLVDPLDGLRVERVVAVGASQSAGRLATYVNAVQPMTVAYDGFLLLIHFGSGAAIDDDLAFGTEAPRPAANFYARTRLRDDLDVPVMVVNSESESRSYHASHQEDNGLFRFWEVAGAAHLPASELASIDALARRDGVPGIDAPTRPSNISYVPAASAALAHLQRWMAGGPLPPSLPPIETSGGDPVEIERDEHGNALGGVRMPAIDVPVAQNTGVSLFQGLGALAGGREPFTLDELIALYGNHDTYLARFSTAAEAAVGAGVLRQTEADRLVQEARESHRF